MIVGAMGQGRRLRAAMLGTMLAAAPFAAPAAGVVVTPAGGQAAIAAAIASGAAAITLQPGIYRFAAPLILTTPVRITGAPGGPVILTGSIAATPTTPPPALLRLVPAAARGKVRAYALPPALATAFAQEAPRSSLSGTPISPVVVTQGEQMLHLAQWPNQGYSRATASAPQPGPHAAPVFAAAPGKAAAWAREPMLRAGGYWAFDWVYETARVASISGGNVQLAPLATKYAERSVLRYRVLNAFSELDAPGEYAVDQATGTLLVWPLGPAPVEIAGLDTVVSIQGAQNVAIDGLAIQGARGDALVVKRSTGISYTNGFLGLAGGNGATVADSRSVLIDHTLVSDTGKTGVAVAGGDKRSLTPANDTVSNSVFRRFGQLTRTYQPGVSVDGVGQRIVGNVFSDAPHAAIIFLGNNHRITGNEVTRVLTETGDAGAIYTFQDLSARGTVIERNYIHDIRRPADLAETTYADDDRAIYLDGWTSGVSVRGNLITNTPWSVFVNSGSDNDVTGNVFTGANPYAIHVLDLTHDYVAPTNGYVRQTVGKISAAMASAYHIDRRDPSLADGFPRRNHIGANLVIGGQAIGFLEQGAVPRFSMQVAQQQVADPQTLVAPPPGLSGSPAAIVPFAQSYGYLAGTTAAAFERASALSGLRYSTLQAQ